MDGAKSLQSVLQLEGDIQASPTEGAFSGCSQVDGAKVVVASCFLVLQAPKYYIFAVC